MSWQFSLLSVKKCYMQCRVNFFSTSLMVYLAVWTWAPRKIESENEVIRTQRPALALCKPLLKVNVIKLSGTVAHLHNCLPSDHMDATLGLYPRGSVFRQLRGCLSITSVKIQRALDGWFRIGVEMTNHLETIFATIRDCVGTCPCGSMNTWKLRKSHEEKHKLHWLDWLDGIYRGGSDKSGVASAQDLGFWPLFLLFPATDQPQTPRSEALA